MRILWLIVRLWASEGKYQQVRLYSSLEDGRPNLFVFWTPIFYMPLGQMSNCVAWMCPLLWVELHFVLAKAFPIQELILLSTGEISELKCDFLQAAFRCRNTLKRFGFFEDWLLYLFNLCGVLYLMSASYWAVWSFSLFYRHTCYWKITQWNSLFCCMCFELWLVSSIGIALCSALCCVSENYFFITALILVDIGIW